LSRTTARLIQKAQRGLATAEIAVRTAFTAVESTDQPVKIEVEILQGLPATTLLEAGRAAAMICIGATGIKHATSGRVGSTAAALAGWGHSPVAIIRDTTHCRPSRDRWSSR
jgi:nucleotide-binding universal stress UspA family protein